MASVNYYQPWLKHFLGPVNFGPGRNPRCYYYYSFEDGLWDLLNNKFPKKQELTFLVPNFYCMNVLDNIKSKGHKIVFYPLDKNFQISADKLIKVVQKCQPDILIIFHACGITAEIPKVSKSVFIIEDAVHRLANPKDLKFVSDRHVIIDSLRKVSPFPGSRMWGKNRALDFRPIKRNTLNRYLIESLFFYIAFRLTLKIGFLIGNAKIITYAHEYLLKKHDQIIGNNLIPQPGLKFWLPLIERINYQTIRQTKISQVKMYINSLQNIFENKYFYQVKIPKKDFGDLHVYPLGFNIRPKKELEDFLHKSGMSVWYKFPDCPWSKNKGVLFLPLGFHINEKKILAIIDTLKKWA